MHSRAVTAKKCTKKRDRREEVLFLRRACGILGDPGADSGGERKSKQAEKYGIKEK